MESNCIFCKIVNGDIPGDIICENEYFICFKDLYPKAKVHVLVVTKEHRRNVLEMTKEEGASLSDFLKLVEAKLSLEDGFRIISNKGKNAKQEVDHLHFHILGGEQL